MGEIVSVIQAILKGVKSPVNAGIGALIALFMYFFILVQKGELRERAAEQDKEDQKKETNTDLENSNAEADDSVRDRLEQRKKS
jgi:predicted PurR-regulated permease PerM